VVSRDGHRLLGDRTDGVWSARDRGIVGTWCIDNLGVFSGNLTTPSPYLVVFGESYYHSGNNTDASGPLETVVSSNCGVFVVRFRTGTGGLVSH